MLFKKCYNALMKFLKTFVIALICMCVLGSSVANAAMLCCLKTEQSHGKNMPCHKALDGKVKKHDGCQCQSATQAQIFPLPVMQHEATIEQISQAILPEKMRSLEDRVFYQPPKHIS